MGRFRSGVLAMFIIAWMLTLWFAFIREFPYSPFEVMDLRGDHALHLLAFAALTFLALLLWSSTVRVGLLMAGVGASIEILQFYSARDANLGDWAASSSGVIVGLLLFLPLRHLQRRETTLPLPDRNQG